MFLRKKGQSTAEYAIVIGLVIAVAAGVLQNALKSGIRQKHEQAVNYLLKADVDDVLEDAGSGSAPLYTQDWRETTVKKADYADKHLVKTGGAEEKYQKQTTDTSAVSIETLDANTGTDTETPTE